MRGGRYRRAAGDESVPTGERASTLFEDYEGALGLIAGHLRTCTLARQKQLVGEYSRVLSPLAMTDLEAHVRNRLADRANRPELARAPTEVPLARPVRGAAASPAFARFREATAGMRGPVPAAREAMR